MVTTVPVQHRMLPEEGYDAASYLVEYEGSGHVYALHLHPLRFICIEVLCWHEVEMRSITLLIYGGGLFIVYHALYFFMEILLDILHNVVYFFYGNVIG